MSEHDNQRASARVPLNLDLEIRHKGETLHGLVLNCSLTGMFIRTGSKFERGEQIEVTIPLPGQRILALSRVIWTDWREQANSGGFGIHFIPLTEEGTAALRTFLYG